MDNMLSKIIYESLVSVDNRFLVLDDGLEHIVAAQSA